MCFINHHRTFEISEYGFSQLYNKIEGRDGLYVQARFTVRVVPPLML